MWNSVFNSFMIRSKQNNVVMYNKLTSNYVVSNDTTVHNTKLKWVNKYNYYIYIVYYFTNILVYCIFLGKYESPRKRYIVPLRFWYTQIIKIVCFVLFLFKFIIIFYIIHCVTTVKINQKVPNWRNIFIFVFLSLFYYL